MHVDWQGALAIAVIVVGVIQYLKLFFPKETNTKVWAGINIVLCFGIAAAIWQASSGSVSLVEAIILGGLALAISQLAYEVIVQGVPNLVSAVLQSVAGVAKPLPAPEPPAQPQMVVGGSVQGIGPGGVRS